MPVAQRSLSALHGQVVRSGLLGVHNQEGMAESCCHTQRYWAWFLFAAMETLTKPIPNAFVDKVEKFYVSSTILTDISDKAGNKMIATWVILKI